MKNNGIMIVGDVHGCFAWLNELLNKKRPEIVLACGDFGYWPRVLYRNARGRPAPQQTPKPAGGKLYWCDGNHEDFQSLQSVPLTGEIWPDVFWMRRGERLTLPDGRVVLFFGGAESTDRAYRTEGVDWFPEERITQAEVESVPSGPVDIVISHTAPMEFLVDAKWCEPDPSRTALSQLLTRVQPREWYFGHFHKRSLGEAAGCKWTALNMVGEGGSWVWLT